MNTQDRLMINIGGDTTEFEKKLRGIADDIDNLDRKSSTLFKKMKDGSWVDTTRQSTNIERLADGYTRLITLVEKYNKSGNWEQVDNITQVNAKYTAQEIALQRLIDKQKTLTSEQKNTSAALNNYLTQLQTIASMKGYSNESAAAAKANQLFEAEINRAANRAYTEITKLEKERFALEKKINTALDSEKANLLEQRLYIEEQIADKTRILEITGIQSVTLDNMAERERALLEIERQRVVLEQRKDLTKAADVRLLNTEYGYVVQLYNAENQLVTVLDKEYAARMRNNIAAQQMSKILESQNAKHVNNGTVLGKAYNSAIYSTAGATQYMAYSAVRDAYVGIKEFEEGIVDLRRTIQGVTETELKEFGETAITYAKEFGIEIKEVQDAMTELARAGVDDADTLKDMTKVVSIGLNTTEIETAAEMTGYLISTVKQLGMDMKDSMEIIDTWNYLADQYAVHTDDFALAIQRSGSASKNLGLSLYDVNALVTILGEATQASGENIGTALRSMEVRLLRPDTIKVLESYGIAVKKNEDEFLSFQEIMQNVSNVIKDMEENSVDLNNIMDALGGSWRKNWVTTLSNDWERFDELVEEQQNNIGYSVAENEKAMDTLAKKTEQAKQAWLEFAIIAANESNVTEMFKDMADASAVVAEIGTGSKIGVFLFDLLQVALVLSPIFLTLTAINKVVGTDLPNSFTKLAEQLRGFDRLADNKILGGISAATDRELIGNRLAESFNNAKGSIDSYNYSLEEQLLISKEIDKVFGTTTASLAQQRLNIQLLRDEVTSINTALEHAKSVGADKDRIQALNNQLVQSETSLKTAENAYMLASEKSNATAKATVAARQQIMMANLKLITSQVALNAVMGIGVSLLITGVIKAIDMVVNHQKRLIETGQEAADAYSALDEKYKDNIKTLEDVKDRYKQLSSGVNELGENVSLSTKEYEEYLDIIDKVRDLTPELVNGYALEGQTIKDKNTLIEESIELLKEEERLSKLNALNKNALDMVNGYAAQAEKHNSYNITEAEAIQALRAGVINKAEFDTLMDFDYGKWRPGEIYQGPSVTEVEPIKKKMVEQAGKWREDVIAAHNGVLGVLKEYASVTTAYADLTMNEQEFINSIIDNTDAEYVAQHFEDTRKFIQGLTEKVGNEDAAGLLIDQIVNADKTEMRMDEYEAYVMARVKELYSVLELEYSDYEVEHLMEALDVKDPIDNIKLLREELMTLIGVSEEAFNSLKDNNDINSLYALYETFNNISGLDDLAELESIVGEVADETGALNTELLQAISQLDSIGSLRVFNNVVEELKQVDEIQFDEYSEEMYDLAADFVDALKLEELDMSNVDAFIESMSVRLDSFFTEQIKEVNTLTDDIYSLIESYNDFAALDNEISTMDRTSKEYYDTMSELARKYPEFIEGVDESTGAYIMQADTLDILRQKQLDEMETKKQSALRNLEAAEAFIDWGKSALASVGSVVDSVNAAGVGLSLFGSKVFSSLGDFINGFAVFGETGNALGNFFKAKAIEFKLDGTDDEGGGLLDGVDSILQNAQENLDNWKGKIGVHKKLLSSTSHYKGSEFGNTSSSSSTDEYTAKADAYHKYTQRLGDIQQLLTENGNLEQTMTDSLENQIKVLSERNALLDMENDATLDLMKAKKKELSESIEDLNKLGYEIDWDNDANTILIKNYEKLETVTGDAAKEQEEMLKTVITLNDEIREYSNAIDENTIAIYNNNYAIQERKWKEDIDAQIDAYKKQEEALKQYESSLEKLLDISVDMLRKEAEAEKEAISNTTDAYKELLEAKRAALLDEADEEDYAAELAKRQKEVATLQNKIKELSNDNSAQANAQRLTLEEELAAAQDELYKYQRDHNLELAQDALDKELEAFEKMQDDKIDDIDDYLSQEGALREQAMQQITSNNTDFYNRLLEYNRMYGDGLNSTVVNAWNDATNAVDEFGVESMHTLEILTEIAYEMERISDAAEALNNAEFIYNPEETYGSTSSSEKVDILSERGKQQLNQQTYLHNLMVKAKEENNTGLITWIKNNRKEWGLDPETGAIIEQFHQGGFVGGKPKLRSNERFAKVLDGEFYITPQQMDNFMNNVWPRITERSGATQVNIDNLINVEGNVDKTTIPAMQNAADNAIKELNNYFAKNGYTRNTKKTVI